MCGTEKVGYLGPEGSYSHLAARAFRPNADLRAYGSFALAVEAVVRGECGAAALPIENSLNGSVAQVMDLLQYTENVFAFGELPIKIDHRFAVLQGRITAVFRAYIRTNRLWRNAGGLFLKTFPTQS